MKVDGQHFHWWIFVSMCMLIFMVVDIFLIHTIIVRTFGPLLRTSVDCFGLGLESLRVEVRIRLVEELSE